MELKLSIEKSFNEFAVALRIDGNLLLFVEQDSIRIMQYIVVSKRVRTVPVIIGGMYISSYDTGRYPRTALKSEGDTVATYNFSIREVRDHDGIRYLLSYRRSDSRISHILCTITFDTEFNILVKFHKQSAIKVPSRTIQNSLIIGRMIS